MDEYGLHPQCIGNQTGVLPAGTAKTLQREARRVVPLLHRYLLDRVRHIGHCDLQEALGDLVRSSLLSCGLRNLFRQYRELRSDDVRVQWCIPLWAEDRREMARLDLADADI